VKPTAETTRHPLSRGTRPALRRRPFAPRGPAPWPVRPEPHPPEITRPLFPGKTGPKTTNGTGIATIPHPPSARDHRTFVSGKNRSKNNQRNRDRHHPPSCIHPRSPDLCFWEKQVQKQPTEQGSAPSPTLHPPEIIRPLFPGKSSPKTTNGTGIGTIPHPPSARDHPTFVSGKNRSKNNQRNRDRHHPPSSIRPRSPDLCFRQKTVQKQPTEPGSAPSPILHPPEITRPLFPGKTGPKTTNGTGIGTIPHPASTRDHPTFVSGRKQSEDNQRNRGASLDPRQSPEFVPVASAHLAVCSRPTGRREWAGQANRPVVYCGCQLHEEAAHGKTG
jgi:hypothetical protein